MYLRVHRNEKGTIVAACDEELVGKVLEDKDRYMDIDKHRGFFVGEKAGKAELEKALAEFSSANLVGKGPVEVAIALGLAEKRDVMYINRTPYIQIYRI